MKLDAVIGQPDPSGVLPQHPDEHRPQRPVLLAVEQQLGEGARLGVPPERADLGVNDRRGDARRVLSTW